MFYGLDELGKFLFIIWAVLCVLGNITKNRTLIMLDTVVIIYALFRMTSPNKSKRYYENQKYKSLFKNFSVKSKPLL